jgi:hypothetical protein
VRFCVHPLHCDLRERYADPAVPVSADSVLEQVTLTTCGQRFN